MNVSWPMGGRLLLFLCNICYQVLSKEFGNFQELPYFFGYKTEFFSFQNNPKDLDSSCKTDLDLWDCLGRVKLVL